MFKHTVTGIIYNNRKECMKIMGQCRYRMALKNREFIFNYELKEGESPISTVYSQN